MHQYLQAIMTVMSLVNPVISASIFASIAAGKSSSERFTDATKGALAVVVILSLAALFGAQLLRVFGISLPAFQVAGGLVLSLMGFIMLRGNSSPTSASAPQKQQHDQSDDKTQPSAEHSQTDPSSLAPLILFAASPGTITGVITLSVAHTKSKFPVTALVAVAVAMSVTWLVMILSSRTSHQKKPGLMRDVTSRFMGLIVLAMGVQFLLSGLSEFFKLT